jgi:alpha,alpha-trehalase
MMLSRWMICCTLEEWNEKANFRKEKMNELCWNEESSMHFDYDFVNKKHPYQVTISFSFIRQEMCSEHQAKN